MKAKTTTLKQRIKRFFVFTKNCLIIYFQGLKEVTGKKDCQWNINSTYFKGDFAEQKRNDFAKNVQLLGRYYENNVRYDFNPIINTNQNTNIAIGYDSLNKITTGTNSQAIGKNASNTGA